MDKKVAVVTGASSGIGKAVCNSLMNRNYNVVANGRSVKKFLKNVIICCCAH